MEMPDEALNIIMADFDDVVAERFGALQPGEQTIFDPEDYPDFDKSRFPERW